MCSVLLVAEIFSKPVCVTGQAVVNALHMVKAVKYTGFLGDRGIIKGGFIRKMKLAVDVERDFEREGTRGTVGVENGTVAQEQQFFRVLREGACISFYVESGSGSFL